jgi:hypothetical protein
MISEQIHWNKERFVKQNAKQDETVQQNEAIGDLKRKQYFRKNPLNLFYFIFVLTPLSAIFQLYHGGVVEEAVVPRENHRPWASNW